MANFCACGKAITRTAHKCKSCAMLGNTRLLGHVATAETCAKLSESHRGILHTEETKRKIAATKYGDMNPHWNGGTCNIRGYIQILCPKHPAASNNGYVPEHRLVMERMIGRYLTPEEVVHHKDGSRSNNQEANLMLFPDSSAHMLFHAAKQTEATA